MEELDVHYIWIEWILGTGSKCDRLWCNSRMSKEKASSIIDNLTNKELIRAKPTWIKEKCRCIISAQNLSTGRTLYERIIEGI